MNLFLIFLVIVKLVDATNETVPNEDQTDVSVLPKPISIRVDKNSCNCKIKVNQRIVGGSEAPAHSVPWLVSLADSKNDHFCGGAIINSMLILTAAHCFSGLTEGEDINVRVGLHKLDDPNIEQKTYKAGYIYNHNLQDTRSPGDIAIIELQTPIRFKEGLVEPGCFGLTFKDFPLGVSFSGWGAQKSSTSDLATGVMKIEEMSNVLKTAELIQTESTAHSVTVESQNKDYPCHGDSGGPLHYTENGVTKIEGVASFVVGKVKDETKSFKCTGSTFFSRLNYYRRWFNYLTQNKYCTSYHTVA